MNSNSNYDENILSRILDRVKDYCNRVGIKKNNNNVEMENNVREKGKKIAKRLVVAEMYL